jgi:hypothetical protein
MKDNNQEKEKCPNCGYEPNGRGWLISNPVKCPECLSPITQEKECHICKRPLNQEGSSICSAVHSSLEERFREGVKTLLTTYDIRRMDGTTYGVSEEFEEDFKRILLSETARAREEGEKHIKKLLLVNYGSLWVSGDVLHIPTVSEAVSEAIDEYKNSLISQVEGMTVKGKYHGIRANGDRLSGDCGAEFLLKGDVITLLKSEK